MNPPMASMTEIQESGILSTSQHGCAATSATKVRATKNKVPPGLPSDGS
ncbi:MAG: hypothetical protein WBA57_17365 [Elainellaceae cyanobacterium]